MYASALPVFSTRTSCLTRPSNVSSTAQVTRPGVNVLGSSCAASMSSACAPAAPANSASTSSAPSAAALPRRASRARPAVCFLPFFMSLPLYSPPL